MKLFIRCIFLNAFLLSFLASEAQQGVTNSGNMHLFPGATMSTPLPFTNNAAGGTDYTNDGYFYAGGDFTNNKASMPAGSGTTEFNGSSTQNINGSQPAQFNHILISNASASGILPAANISIAGNWINNGTFTHNSKNVLFNGSALQTLSGTSKTVFYDFTLNNNTSPVSLNLQQTTDLLNIFSFTTSNSTLASGGNLNVKSSAARTAQIADMTAGSTLSGNSITGDAIVERYIQSGRKWRFLSIPTNSTQTVRDAWMETAANISQNPKPGFGTVVTDQNAGAVAAGFDAQSVSGPSVKYYVPATDSYTGITSPSVIIGAQRAYMNFVRGDRTSLPSNAVLTSTTLRTTGPLKQGNISVSIGSGLFEAVGNPYASRIDLRIVGKTNLTDYIYLWDPMLAGSYGVGGFQTLQYNGTDYTIMPGGGNYPAAGSIMDSVESGQAFFMQAQSGGGSANFTEPVKIAGSYVVNFTSGNPQQLRALLSISNGSQLTLLDGAQADFAATHSNNVDFKDGIKMMNTSENVAIKSADKLLVYERRSPVVNDDTIHLNVTGYRNAAYHWDFNAVNMDEPGRVGFIVDRLNNSLTPLMLAGTTPYDFTVNGGASAAADRFFIVFKTASVLPVTITGISARRLNDGNIEVKWNTANELNVHHYDVERSADGNSFGMMSTGHLPVNNAGGSAAYSLTDISPLNNDNYYRIRIIFANGSIRYSAVVKVGPAGMIKPEIAVYPNPVKDKIINTRFINQPTGKYNLKLINAAGQTVIVDEHTISNSNEVISTVLPKSFAAGVYRLVIAAPGGQTVALNIVIE